MKVALAVAALSLVQPAHSWYPFECCSDQDCEPVSDAVEVPGGYQTHGIFVPMAKVRPSQDGRYHWCHRDGTVFCFFAPLAGKARGLKLCWRQDVLVGQSARWHHAARARSRKDSTSREEEEA